MTVAVSTDMAQVTKQAPSRFQFTPPGASAEGRPPKNRVSTGVSRIATDVYYVADGPRTRTPTEHGLTSGNAVQSSSVVEPPLRKAVRPSPGVSARSARWISTARIRGTPSASAAPIRLQPSLRRFGNRSRLWVFAAPNRGGKPTRSRDVRPSPRRSVIPLDQR